MLEHVLHAKIQSAATRLHDELYASNRIASRCKERLIDVNLRRVDSKRLLPGLRQKHFVDARRRCSDGDLGKVRNRSVEQACSVDLAIRERRKLFNQRKD